MTTDEILHNRDIALQWGIKPSRITPKLVREVRSRVAERDSRIRENIAKLKGTYNGKRLYLDADGNPTTINPAAEATPVKEKIVQQRRGSDGSRRTIKINVTSKKQKKESVPKPKLKKKDKTPTKKQLYYDAWKKNPKATATQLRKKVGVPIADKTINKWLQRWPKGLSIPIVRITINLKVKPSKRK